MSLATAPLYETRLRKIFPEMALILLLPWRESCVTVKVKVNSHSTVAKDTDGIAGTISDLQGCRGLRYEKKVEIIDTCFGHYSRNSHILLIL